MGAVEKFIIETSFDVMESAVAAKDAAEEEIIEPTFTQEQLDAARNKGIAAGKQEGATQAAEETERLTAQALQAISDHMAAFAEHREQVRAEAIEGSTAVAVAITRKVFPDLEQQNALGEVHRLVETTVSRLMEESRITVHVSQALHQQVTQRLRDLIVSKGYEGQLVVLEGPGLAIGDCRIDWSNGSALRDTAATWKAIEDVMQRNIGDGFLDLVDAGKAEEALAEEPGENTETLLGDSGAEAVLPLPADDAPLEPDAPQANEAGGPHLDHTEPEPEPVEDQPIQEPADSGIPSTPVDTGNENP